MTLLKFGNAGCLYGILAVVIGYFVLICLFVFQAVSDAEWEWSAFAALTAAARLIATPVSLILRCLTGCERRTPASTNSGHLKLFCNVPLASVTAEASRWSTLAGKLARLASV